MFGAIRDFRDSALFELVNEYGNAVPMRLKKSGVILPSFTIPSVPDNSALQHLKSVYSNSSFHLTH